MGFLRATVAVLLCAIALLVPLALWPALIFPFIVAKAILFRSLLVLALIPWLLLLALDPAARPRMSRTAVMLLLTLLALLIADIGSDHPRSSFFSGFERMEGFITWAYLGLFFFMMRSVMRGRAARAFQWCLVASSVIICLIAFVGWGPNRPQPNSTFGNPSYVGQYAAMMTFLALSLVKEVMPHKSGDWTPRILESARRHKLPPPASLLALGAAFLNVLAVFASGSRGALLALAVGAIVYFILVNSPPLQKLALGCLAALGAGFLFYHDQPLLLRVTTLGVWDNRPHIWQTAWTVAQIKPIFGWGQDELRYAFCAVHDPFCPQVDRAHNLVLDWLTQAGIVGLYCWGGFLLAIRREARNLAAPAGIYALLACYVVSDLTLFDTLPVLILLIGTAAITSRASAADSLSPAKRDARPELPGPRPAYGSTAVLRGDD